MQAMGERGNSKEQQQEVAGCGCSERCLVGLVAQFVASQFRNAAHDHSDYILVSFPRGQASFVAPDAAGAIHFPQLYTAGFIVADVLEVLVQLFLYFVTSIDRVGLGQDHHFAEHRWWYAVAGRTRQRRVFAGKKGKRFRAHAVGCHRRDVHRLGSVRRVQMVYN